MSSFLGIHTPTVVTATAQIWLSIGDSLMAGVLNRQVPPDLAALPAGIMQWGYNHVTGLVSTLPLDCPSTPADTDVLSPIESFLVQQLALTGLDQYIIQVAIGGSQLNQWTTGTTNFNTAVAAANAAIVAIQAIDPTAEFAGIASEIITNNALISTNDVTFYNDYVAMIGDFRAAIFQNGVSGTDVSSSAVLVMGALPEMRATNPAASNKLERRLQQMGYTVSNCRYFAWDYGYALGDNLHPNRDGNRWAGPALSDVARDTAPPIISAPTSFSIYAGQKLARAIVTDKPAYPYLTGADASLFEIVPLDTYASGASSYLYGWYLRFASNGDAPAAGTYNITINAKGPADTPGTLDVVVTTVAAYGSQVEAIVATYTDAPSASTGAGYGGFDTLTFSNVHFKRGVNTLTFAQTAGGISGLTSATASNGLVGLADTANSGDQGAFHFYSAQDEVVNIALVQAGTSGGGYATVINLVGTTAAPTSSQISTSATVSQTVNANGIATVGGFATSGITPPSGQTALTCTGTEADPGVQYAGYRTNTGSVGAQGGFSRLFAASWDKAT